LLAESTIRATGSFERVLQQVLGESRPFQHDVSRSESIEYYYWIFVG
jgi:hypothetical protein